MKIPRHIAVIGAATFALLAALPGVSLSQSSSGAGTRSVLDPPPPAATKPADAATSNAVEAAPPKPTLAEFSWLAGRWQGAWGPRVAQQTWSAPKAGVMVGTFQLEENDRTLVLELFTVVDGPDGIKFHLRHFTPSLVAWEKPGPTVLALASGDAKSIVFENSLDGQPKRTTLTRVDPDTYVARSEVIPEKGQPQVTEITYHRVKDAPAPKAKR